MNMARARMLRFTAFVILTSMVSLAGCSSGPATLTVKPETRNVSFAQTFPQAYCGKTRDGSYTIVLASDGATPKTSGDTPASDKAPLQPAAELPLRQVVNVRVLWRPMNGLRDSLASNATIDWYVLRNTSDGSDDLLLYQGSAYVTLKPDDDTTQVTIRSAELRPSVVRGNLTDPIGTSMVAGTFTAVNDNNRTIQLVAAARERTATMASGH